MATINEMRQVATQIENETQVGGNTASRVGGLFNDVVDKLEDQETTIDGNVTTIKMKRNTAAGFTSSNPVLADGELGFETDSKRYKMGDGVTAWNSLEYRSKELDATPTQGSTNGAMSGGVYNSLKYISQGNNFFNRIGYINPLGKDGQNSSYSRTDYLLVDKTKNITISNAYAGASSLLLAFYNEKKEFISGIGNGTSATVMYSSIPSNAFYVRFGTRNQELATAKVEFCSISGLNDMLVSAKEQTNRLNFSPKLNSVGYYNTSGTFVGSSLGKNTGLFEVSGYRYLEYFTYMPSTGAAVVFCDEGQTILTSLIIVGNGYTEGVVDLHDSNHENVKYAIVSCYDTSREFTNYKCKLYNNNSLENVIDNNSDYINSNKDLIYKADFNAPFTRKGLYQVSNNQWYANNNYDSTELVEIKNYHYLRYVSVMGVNDQHYSVAFFDENQNIITSLGVLGKTTMQSGIIDLTSSDYENAKYVVVTNATGYQPWTVTYRECRLTAEKSIDLTIEKFGYALPCLKPLNILIFGDSITDTATITINSSDQTTAYSLRQFHSYTYNGSSIWYSFWPYLLTRYFNCYDLRNYARSGASYKTLTRDAGNERQNLEYQIKVAINDLSNPNDVFPTQGTYVPDIIIFALGTNDGSPNDTYESAMAKTVMNQDNTAFDIQATLNNLDTSKTCEAIRYAFLKIKNQFPQALCMCVLPIQRFSTAKPSINDVLKKMAERYSIKVIDGASDCGIVQDLEVSQNFGTNLKDGLHPNEKGQNLYTRMMVNAIKNNYVEPSLMNV